MPVRLTRRRSLCLGALALAPCVVFLAVKSEKRVTASQAPALSFATVNVWDSTLDPQTTALYQNLAITIANGMTGVPAARPAFYSAYNDGQVWAIGSWGASVYAVVPGGNGGYNVTLVVGPNFTVMPQGVTSVGGGYFEIYNVDANNDVTYLGSQDPDGLSGGQLNAFAS